MKWPGVANCSKCIPINPPCIPTSSIYLLENIPPIGSDIGVKVDIVVEYGGVALFHNHRVKLFVTETFCVNDVGSEGKTDIINVYYTANPLFDMIFGELDNGQVSTPNCKTAY